MSNEPTITLTLSEFIYSYLGNGYWHYRSIPESIAKKVVALTKNEHSLYVQHADKYDPSLKMPVLWAYHEWAISSDKWERSARRMQLEKDAQDMMDYNVLYVAKVYATYMGLTVQESMSVAHNLLNKKGKSVKFLKLIGIDVSKLITKIEELP